MSGCTYNNNAEKETDICMYVYLYTCMYTDKHTEILYKIFIVL